MTIILGIDPGLRHTGWGIIEASGNHIQYIGCGVISSDSKAAMSDRLRDLSEGLKIIIEKYDPDQCALEETFLNKNPSSSLKLGHARGAIMLTLSNAGLDVKEYAATLVKKSIVGVGRAEKGQVMMMVKRLLPAAEVNSEDAGDALAVAICHLNHAKISNILEKVI